MKTTPKNDGSNKIPINIFLTFVLMAFIDMVSAPMEFHPHIIVCVAKQSWIIGLGATFHCHVSQGL